MIPNAMVHKVNGKQIAQGAKTDKPYSMNTSTDL